MNPVPRVSLLNTHLYPTKPLQYTSNHIVKFHQRYNYDLSISFMEVIKVTNLEGQVNVSLVLPSFPGTGPMSVTSARLWDRASITDPTCSSLISIITSSIGSSFCLFSVLYL